MGLTPEEVDLVIWTGEEYKDYIAQTASIRLQEETGCKNAWAFDLVGQNVTSIQGLRVARDFILGDESVHTILLAGGTRNVDLVDPANPDTRFLLASSASGGAMILKRNYPRNRLIQTAFTIDHEMADEVYVPGGGTETPFAPDNLDSKIMFYQTPRPRVVKDYLARRWVPALAETGQKVLKGLVSRLCSPSSSQARRKERRLSKTWESNRNSPPPWTTGDVMEPTISFFPWTWDCGSALLMTGSLVLLLSGGIGFTYAAALIQWGER